MKAPGTESPFSNSGWLGLLKTKFCDSESEASLFASGAVVGPEEGEAGIDVVIGGGDVEEHGVERRIAEVAHLGVGGR